MFMALCLKPFPTTIMTNIQVKVKKLHEDARLPTYATDGSGCFDIYNAEEHYRPCSSKELYTDVSRVYKTNLAFEVPEGHVMLVFSRSGHAFHNDIRLANCVGVIDSDYRGELLIKLKCDGIGRTIYPGDAIAQALIVPIPRVEFVLSDTLSSTERGAGGFGSTGN